MCGLHVHSLFYYLITSRVWWCHCYHGSFELAVGMYTKLLEELWLYHYVIDDFKAKTCTFIVHMYMYLTCLDLPHEWCDSLQCGKPLHYVCQLSIMYLAKHMCQTNCEIFWYSNILLRNIDIPKLKTVKFYGLVLILIVLNIMEKQSC